MTEKKNSQKEKGLAQEEPPKGGSSVPSHRGRQYQVTADLLSEEARERLDALATSMNTSRSEAIRYSIDLAVMVSQMTAPIAGGTAGFNNITKAIDQLTKRIDDIKPYIRKTRARKDRVPKNKVTDDDRKLIQVWKETFGVPQGSSATIFWPPVLTRIRACLNGGLSYEQIAEMIRVSPKHPFVMKMAEEGGGAPYLNKILADGLVNDLNEIRVREKEREAGTLGDDSDTLHAMKLQLINKLWPRVPEQERVWFKRQVHACPNGEALRKVEAKYLA